MATFNVAVTAVMLVDAPDLAAAGRGAEQYVARRTGVAVMPERTETFAQSTTGRHSVQLAVTVDGTVRCVPGLNSCMA